MKPGEFLVDVDRGEERFKIDSLLADGRSYQIALATDTHMDDKLVCVKTVSYDTARIDEKKYVGLRRRALRDELEFLTLESHLLPEPLDWIQLETSDTVLGREPVLVYEYRHGKTLEEIVREAGGIAPTRALRFFRELAIFLGDIHKEGWIFRDLDPRHVIVGFDDVLSIVGCGNAARASKPPNATKVELNPAYAAPEIRDERGGSTLRPAADIYGLGALLSFMLTGEEPRERVENPLGKHAYDVLSNIEPPGLGLLVAKCMQPMAKNRIARIERLLPFTTMETLPTSTTKGFGMVLLPAPWSGAEQPDNRATRSKLSPGPLISVAKGEGEASPEAKEPAETALEKQDKPRGCRGFFASLFSVVAATLFVTILAMLV
jgi:serine/threonine protein kinase